MIFGVISPRVFALLVFVLLLRSRSASAISFQAASNSTSAPMGATFCALGGGLGTKTGAGFTALGITGGSAGNEIDRNQMLTVKFDTPQYLKSFSLAFLYDGPEFGDPHEAAAIWVNGTSFYKVVACGEKTAEWMTLGPGDHWQHIDYNVINLSPANGVQAGAWQINNPFGGLEIKSLGFFTPNATPGDERADYGLSGFETYTKPLPDSGATAVMLTLAVSGLVVGRSLTVRALKTAIIS